MAISANVVSEEPISALDCLPDFIHWLSKRITSGNTQFALESQDLVLCNINQYGDNAVFLLADALGKYQSRSGIATGVLEHALKKVFANQKTFRIERAGQSLPVLPCRLNETFVSNYSTPILEGNE